MNEIMKMWLEGYRKVFLEVIMSWLSCKLEHYIFLTNAFKTIKCYLHTHANSKPFTLTLTTTCSN